MALFIHTKISVSLLTAFFFFSILFAGIGSAATISVENVSDSVTDADLVNILLGENSNVTVSNISITGSNAAIGHFTSGGSLGFDTGVVMSTGLISNISNDMSNFANTNNSQPGDSDLSTLVNDTTFDAIILEFDFVPEKSGINFNYRFSSEESFTDVYDDAFGLFVNGENIALLPNGNPVSVINIGNGTYYEPGPLNNCFNGSSIILTATAEVVPGTLNHMKFAIADARDGVYDSGVFIEGGSFVSNTIPNAPASPLCEGETNPTDITDLTPEFSWTFSDPDVGDIQGAYQIQVGTTEGGSDMWDSGQVTSSSSTDISYAGSDLDYSTTYYWRIRTWDNNNAAGPYCENQTFTTAEEILSPVANFTANVTSGSAPLSVNFTDLSTNTPASWLWDFGDGSTSNDQSPTHTYTSGGTYTVSLSATNTAGSNTSTHVDYITVVVATTVNASHSSVTYYENDNMTVDAGINVTGSSTFTSARVYIGDGYVAGEDFLRFTNSSNITGSFSGSTGVLTLTGNGNAAAYQAAFRNIRYENINENPNTADRNITFVLGDNALYSQDTGHYYEYIASAQISWTDAKTAAEARSLSGMQGYLATITSQEENDFISSKIQGEAWIGASDAASEWTWRLVTGPEGLEDNGSGRHFFTQTGNDPNGGGLAVGGYYNNWVSGEPNAWPPGEDYAHLRSNGEWNDYADYNDGIKGYFVEYGGMPDESTPQLTATIVVNVTSVNDAPTTPGAFTSPTSGQIKQGGQSMTAGWGVSTDPEDDAVKYDLWFFNGSWTKIGNLLASNSMALTLPQDNTDSAMFRVYANDTQDNSSARDVTFTIDSLGPVIVYGTNGNSTYSKNHSTTATGADTVAGLAQIAYAWTQDSDVGSVSSWTDFVNGATLIKDAVSGDWYLHINATDNVNNSNYSVSNVFKLDNSLPVIYFGTDGNATYAQSHSSTITCADTISGLQEVAYSWSQNFNVGSVSSWTVCNSGDTVTKNSVNGNWYLHVRSIDNAGNVNYSTSNVFRLDNGLSLIDFGTDGSDTYAKSHSTDVTVSDTLSGIHQLAYAWTQDSDAGSVSQWTTFTNGATLTRSSGDGDWYLHIRAIDNASNVNYSVSSNFRLDNTAPAYTWLQKPLNAETGDTVVIELNATDVSSISECIITVDGEDHQMNTSSGGYSWTVDIPASDSETLVSQVIYSCTLSDLLGSVASTGNIRMNVSILPIADFTADATRGTAPLTVSFEDDSFGLVEDWNWDFGDGSTSTEQNPVHTFGSGDFTVNLTVTNSNGTSSQQLNINAAEPLSCTTSPEDTDLISIYGEETNFSVTTNILSSFSWYIDGTPISGDGITMSYNDDDSSTISFCSINTSEYIGQDDFFVDDYNISVVVSNETTGMSDTFSWDWTVTNSSVEDGDDICFVISQTPDITSSGNMSYVGFNTTDDENIDNSNLTGSITFVSFTTLGNASDLRIKVEVLDKSSLNESEAGFSQDSVYQYLDISFSNQTLVDTTGLNRSIEFRVLNERDGGSLAITSVMLKHWGNPAWESYVPELLSNDGTYSYFIVRNISGFSPFAITANYEYSSDSGSGSSTGKAIASLWSSQEDSGKTGGSTSSGPAGSKVSTSIGSSTGTEKVAGENMQTNDGIQVTGDEGSNNRSSNIFAAGIVLLGASLLIFFLYRKKREEEK